MHKLATRIAKHAGSWYDNDPERLNQELAGYLSQAEVTLPDNGKLKAIIGPHAGFRFSGPTAACAYKNLSLKAAEYERVVLIGPSHKVYLDFLGTTSCQEWETPLGNIKVDQEAVARLC